MGVTAGIFLASILLKEMRYLVYIRYLWRSDVSKAIHREFVFALLTACFEAISPIDFDFATQTLAIY
jgi:hypothetical protein